MSTLEKALLTRRKKIEDKLYLLQFKASELAAEIERIDKALNALEGK